MNVVYDPDTKVFTYSCPHCEGIIITEYNQLNCKIFRHGVFIDTLKQIGCHANKIECDKIEKTILFMDVGNHMKLKLAIKNIKFIMFINANINKIVLLSVTFSYIPTIHHIPTMYEIRDSTHPPSLFHYLCLVLFRSYCYRFNIYCSFINSRRFNI